MRKFFYDIAGAIIVSCAILGSTAYSNACHAAEVDMVSATADAVLRKGGLRCSVTDIQIRPAEELTFKKVGGGTVELAAFFGLDPKDMHELIRISEKWWAHASPQAKLHVLVHEKIHCARFELVKLAGGRQPPAMDPREEMMTELQTSALLQDSED